MPTVSAQQGIGRVHFTSLQHKKGDHHETHSPNTTDCRSHLCPDGKHWPVCWTELRQLPIVFRRIQLQPEFQQSVLQLQWRIVLKSFPFFRKQLALKVSANSIQ